MHSAHSSRGDTGEVHPASQDAQERQDLAEAPEDLKTSSFRRRLRGGRPQAGGSGSFHNTSKAGRSGQFGDDQFLAQSLQGSTDRLEEMSDAGSTFMEAGTPNRSTPNALFGRTLSTCSAVPSDVSTATLSIDLRNFRGVKEDKLLWHMQVVYQQDGSVISPTAAASASAEIDQRSTVTDEAEEDDDDLVSQISECSQVTDFSDATDMEGQRSARVSKRSKLRRRPRHGNKPKQEEDMQAGSSSTPRIARRAPRKGDQSSHSPSTGGMEIETEASQRVAQPKMCLKCVSGFSGFGDICSTCRRAGKHPSVKQCAGCQAYWTGYGTHCEDCIPMPPPP